MAYLCDADVPTPRAALCLYDDCDVSSWHDLHQSHLAAAIRIRTNEKFGPLLVNNRLCKK